MSPGGSPDLSLAPLYSVDGSRDLPERVAANWAGFNGDGPVRIGNGAALHEQHDIFGELVLTLAPIFHDERFSAERTPATLDLLMRLARKAISVAGTPDSGIWEFRTAPKPQTFSSDDVLGRGGPGGEDRRALRAGAGRRVQGRGRPHPRRRSPRAPGASNAHAFVGAYDGDDLDASLLQMAPLRLFARRRRAASPARSTRSGMTSRTTAGSCGTAKTTASASRRWPSSCAPSG